MRLIARVTTKTRAVSTSAKAAAVPTRPIWKALRNTLYFVVLGGPLSAAASLAAALLVHSKLTRFKPFFRSAFFAPWVTTLVAVALVWRYIYHPQYGLLNAGLGLVGIGPIDWLGDQRWAMPSIIQACDCREKVPAPRSLAANWWGIMRHSGPRSLGRRRREDGCPE